jgi:DNA invertase Pin-like site-specific DNA recombinase
MHEFEKSQNQPLRLCRCQVQNDDDWICKSEYRWPNTRRATDGTTAKAGAARVFAEKQSGAKTDRAQLAKALASLADGDTLVVCKLDRLARSTRDLLNTLAAIAERGATFRSLGDPWCDTTTPHGRLVLTVLGGLAGFERHLILARTGEGRRRAQQRGVKFGRKPSLTAHQRDEALARSYAVSHSTISRLAIGQTGACQAQPVWPSPQPDK